MLRDEAKYPVRAMTLVSIALVLVTSAIYWQVGGHGFLTYDDDLYIVRNPHVSQGITRAGVIWAFSSVEHCNWHPVTWLSHMLDVQLYGMNPRGHHLTNVAIHCSSALLLLWLLFRLTGRLWQSSFVAALFALHPLHVESVAWAAERKDVLSTCFGFLTLLFYSRHAAALRDGGRFRPAFYVLALLSFLFGLMSKPMLVMLPVLMLLLDYWPLQRTAALVILVREKIPFFICSLLASAVTVYAQRRGEAVMPLDWVPVDLRLKNALVSLSKYVLKTLWPHDLAVLYPYAVHIPLWQVVASGTAVLLATLTIIRAGRRNPFLPVGWFWFLATLLPVIGLIQVGNQSMADRYTYLPIVGLFIMTAWGVPALFKGEDTGLYAETWSRSAVGRSRGYLSIVPALSGSVVVLVATFLTWRQIAFWKDDISLYRHTQNVTSGNYIITYNLGIAYGRMGNHDAAIKEFRTAVMIKPNDTRLRNMLAATLAENGYIDAARAEWKTSLAINPQDKEAVNALEFWGRFRGSP